MAVVIAHEIGDIRRFPTAGHLASYAGTTPTVHSSGGTVHLDHPRSEVSRYLKWAFVEAANVVSSHRGRWGELHVVHLHERVRLRRGHQTAAGAVGTFSSVHLYTTATS